eukprot:GDKJ01032554.1.p1 GENE.GDKJ01032554.1~~GDKJ01032554.1.p1  ORF type:complete len:646 (+),score=209.23 GDKJ01032554.1:30-1967(+)
MPNVLVNRSQLMAALGQEYTDEQFEDLCFEFGIELDDITTERAMAEKERGDGKGIESLSDEVLYKIDVPANRYDILCLEGLALALNIFRAKMTPPPFHLVDPVDGPRYRMIVKKDTARIRPYVACAILRGIKFTEASYKSFIDLQQKLHQQVCRKRTLSSIGTHDLRSVEGREFVYDARDPKDIRFVPLKGDGSSTVIPEVDGHGLMALYRNHPQLKAFLEIIESSPVYPVVVDGKNRVMSLPPIINGDLSKMSQETTDIFIECTGTDLTKTNIAINTLVCMFAEQCSTPFAIEKVDVVYEEGTILSGQTITTPEIAPFTMDASLNYMTSLAGIKGVDRAKACSLLSRMGFTCVPNPSSDDLVTVTVPPTRTDILHPCDLAEDLAVAYGYDNLIYNIPKIPTKPNEQPIGMLGDMIRSELAMAGYDECLTWGLVSKDQNYGWLRRDARTADCEGPLAHLPVEDVYDASAPGVLLTDPKSKEFEVVRTSLLPGLLMTLSVNKGTPLPLKLFEVSDVVVLDKTVETNAKNVRRIAAVLADRESNMEEMHGLLDQLMTKMGVHASYAEHARSALSIGEYSLRESSDPAFFPGMAADILFEGVPIGVMGVIHPECNQKADQFPFPICALEMNVRPILKKLQKIDEKIVM